MQYNLFFLGNAGSGKTSLAYVFNMWLKEKGLSSIICNLDPASEYFPYQPDFDIKKYVDAKKIMIEEGLGPNGAILRAVDLIDEKFCRWYNELSGAKDDFIIYDTPGQLETLLYRESGISLLSKIGKNGKTVGVYLIESRLSNSPVSLSVVMMQATITKVRLDLPLVLVISKSDLGVRDDLERLITNMEYLEAKIVKEGIGGQKDTAIFLCRALSEIPWKQRIIKVSSTLKTGLGELYDIVNEALCACGDMT